MELGLIVIGLFAALFVAALTYGVIEHRRCLEKGINIVVGHTSMEEYNNIYGNNSP
jgi:hypothetical protein